MRLHPHGRIGQYPLQMAPQRQPAQLFNPGPDHAIRKKQKRNRPRQMQQHYRLAPPRFRDRAQLHPNWPDPYGPFATKL